VEASAAGTASVAGCSVDVEFDAAVAAAAPPRPPLPPLPPLPLVPVPRALPVAVLGGILVYSCPGLLLSWCCYTIGECDSVFQLVVCRRQVEGCVMFELQCAFRVKKSFVNLSTRRERESDFAGKRNNAKASGTLAKLMARHPVSVSSHHV
jgi:hypothetical protein